MLLPLPSPLQVRERDWSNVLTAQITLLNDHDKLVQSKGQALVDLVALYKALGGGWTEQTP